MSPNVLFLVIGVAVFLPIAWMVSTANRFVKLKNHIAESWANVDVALQRRYDLIPNLVETVKAFASHERELFESIAQAREMARTAEEVGDHARKETEMVRSVNQLLARAEAYPELRSNTNYLALQHELVNTEDRIAAARRFYNANVRDYNTLLDQFPPGIIGRWQGHLEAPFFEVESLDVRRPVAVGL